MDAAAKALLDENAVLKAQLAVALAKASEDMALIAAQKLQIAKLQRQIYGQKSERSARLLDQLSLELEELEASATEDDGCARKTRPWSEAGLIADAALQAVQYLASTGAGAPQLK